MSVKLRSGNIDRLEDSGGGGDDEVRMKADSDAMSCIGEVYVAPRYVPVVHVLENIFTIKIWLSALKCVRLR